MIDAFMALWNMGFMGKIVKVFSAFLLICVSLSLFLMTIGIPGVVRLPMFHDEGNQAGNVVKTSKLGATADVGRPTRPTSLHPTPTAAALVVHPCVSTPVRIPTAKDGEHGRGYGRPGTRQILTPTTTPSATPTPRITPTQEATTAQTVPPTDTIYPTSMPSPAYTAGVPTASTSMQRVSIGLSKASAPPTSRASVGGTDPSGDFTQRLVQNRGLPNCLSNNLAAALDRASMQELERHLEAIVGGSLVGTFLFYSLVFVKLRCKRITRQ